jgi:ATP-binding cassette subfamily F protein uup
MRTAKKELQRLERQLDRLGRREKELTAELAARASDYTALIDLGAQLREVQAERARLEEEWLAVAEEAE